MDEKTFTQAELDEHIKDRLDRQAKKHEAELKAKTDEIEKLKKEAEETKSKYSGFDSQLTEKDEEISNLKSKVKEYETLSAKRAVAEEFGLDNKAMEFIQGETEDEMKASAEKLKALTGSFVPPLASKEQTPVNKLDSAFAELNNNLKIN